MDHHITSLAFTLPRGAHIVQMWTTCGSPGQTLLERTWAITSDPIVPSTMPPIQTIERPWGFFKQYAHNERVTVSLMHVRESGSLSLQTHERRAELWIVLDSGARVEVDNEVFRPSAGEHVWIPRGARHRLSSEKGTVRVLEVAFGNWQLDDIRRYDDIYDREPGKDEN